MKWKFNATTHLLLPCLMLLSFTLLTSNKALAQSYDSTQTYQITDSLFNGQTDAKILHFIVYISGTGASTVSKFAFDTKGTTNTSDIDEARLYYIGIDSSDIPLDINDTIGAPVKNPNGKFTINGQIALKAGVLHNFILAYDIDYDLSHLDAFDASFTSLSVDGKSQTPLTTDPSGNRLVSLYGEGVFCRPTYVNIANYQIGPARVVLGNIIDRRSNGSLILDLVKNVYDIQKDTKYSLDITVGPINPEQIVGWVDWDSDGYFETSELIFSSGNQAVSTTYSNSISVPCDIKPGFKRMRLMSDYGAVAAPTACSGLYSGEAEDYVLNVVPESGPIANFRVDTTTSLLYEGGQIKLTNTSYEPGSRMGYEWDVDDDQKYDSTTTDLTLDLDKAGRKIITLKATFTSCDKTTTYTDTFTDTLWVRPNTNAPIADFIADKNQLGINESVIVRDISDLGPNKWTWTIIPATVGGKAAYQFTNGTNANSQTPSISFNFPGQYSMALSVSNKNGSDYIAKANYITVGNNTLLCPSGVTSLETTTDEFGILYDDGGPNGNYNANLNCQLLIQPKCAEEVHLDLDYIDITPFTVTGLTGDFLRVWDGTSATTGTALHTTIAANGIQAPTTGPANYGRLTATSGAMVVEMISDATGSASGIKVRWSITSKQVTPPSTSITAVDTAYINSPVTFTSSNNNSDISTYWDFNNDELPDVLGTKADYTFTKPGTYEVAVVVQECGAQDTFRHKIEIIAPTKAPVANFTTTYPTISTKDTLFLTNTSLNGPTSFEWTISRPTEASYINGTTSSSKNPMIKFTGKGLYTVTLKATNSFGSDTETKTDYILVRDYCTPTVSTAFKDVGITRVVIETIAGDTLMDNSSVNTNGFQDFSKQKITTLSAGASYVIHVSRPIGTNNIKRAFWIDNDHDGDFETSEFVSQLSSSLRGTWTDTFRVSASATLGYTRMRITANNANGANASCGPNYTGEFEDYGINLVKDESGPTIILTNGENVKVEQCIPWVDPGFKALDDVDGNLSKNVVITGTVDPSKVGTYKLTYTVSDAGNNMATITRTVEVFADTTRPELNITGNMIDTIEVFETYKDLGVTFSDACSGISGTLTKSSNLDTAKVGEYTITYSISDKENNMATTSRTVYVLDRTLPELNFSDTITISVYSEYDESDIIVTDNYDANITYVREGGVDVTKLGTYKLSYSTIDSEGNGPVTKDRYVVVADITAPELVFAYDTIDVAVGNKITLPKPSISDNYDDKPKIITIGAYDHTIIGNYTINYYGEDAYGNKSNQIALVVSVFDAVAPEISLIGDSLIEKCRWDDYIDEGHTVTDNYNDETDITVTTSGNYTNSTSAGSYSIIYTATDKSKNKSIAVRYINVINPEKGSDCFTDIENAEIENSITVFPNPAQNQLTVILNLPTKEQSNVSIENMLGQTVMTIENGSIQAKTYNLDISKLAAGVYYLKVNHGSTQQSQKIVINR